MQVFKVESDNVAYDEDISMIVIAKTEQKALEIAKTKWRFRPSREHNLFKVIEIDMNIEHIVCVSHYGE